MRIRTKLTLSLLGLVAAPLLLIAVLAYYQARGALTEARFASLNSIAELKVRLIEEFYRQRRYDMETFQNLVSISQNFPLFQAQAGQPNRPDFVRTKHLLDNQLRQFATRRGILDIELLDRQGRAVYGLRDDDWADPSREFSLEQSLARRATKEIVFSPFREQTSHRGYEMLGAAPLKDGQGKVIGAVVAAFDMAPFFADIQDVTGLGFTGETLLGRREGNIVMFQNPLRHDPTAALKRMVAMGDPQALPVQWGTKGNGQGIAADYRGVEVVAVWRYIPEFGLSMVAKMDATEAFADVVRLRNVIFLVTFGALAAGVLVAVALSRHFGRPIRRLQEAAQTIGQGRLEHRIGHYGQDELGELAHAFDQMAADLQSVTASRNELEREVAERARIEAELERHVEELSRLNRQLDEFNYVASHDLQEPLRKIQIFGDWLRRHAGESLPDEAKQDLAYITDGAERMQKLVQDLLALSRLGRTALKPVPFPLALAADQALANLALTVEERQAHIERDPLPDVTGDITLLTQLYQNLIGNALKYSQGRPEIRLTAVREDGRWVFGVKDQGIGLNPAYAEQIFLPFKRLHGSGKYQGTGIGLAICRKVVEMHDGRIWAESEEGHGAHFRFTLGETAGGAA